MPEPKVRRFDEISVGDTASFEVAITLETVEMFATLSGDHNPLHVNDEYALSKGFDGRIPHGMIAGALFSRLIGMELPGLYSLYMGQTMHFHNPLPLGTVRVTGTVAQKTGAVQSLKITTDITDAKTGAVLVKGEALVKLLA